MKYIVNNKCFIMLLIVSKVIMMHNLDLYECDKYLGLTVIEVYTEVINPI